MADNGAVKVKLTDLMPDRKNANLHSERGVYMTGRSIEKLGLGRSILVDKDNEVIAGNLTLEQAIDAGFEDGLLVKTDGRTLVIVQREDMDLDDPDTGARQMAYADNRSADVSITFDVDQMKFDFDAGIDLGDWWHDFELEEMGVIEPEVLEDVPPQIDRAEELRENWQVTSGQLWQLGQHRLICGDCTDRAVVDRLMDGEQALATITDPPYNVGIKYTDRTNDNQPFEDYKEWTRRWSQLAPKRRILTVGIQRLVWWDTLLGDPQWIIAWVKRNGQGNTKLGGTNKWDAILVYAVEQDGGIDIIELNNDYSEKIKENGLHPTAKPIELYERLVDRFTGLKDSVYDPFLGSGTTLIACERLNRKCYGIEIEPKYVAVTLERWHDVTGQEPVLIS